ncbi:hypothetical protein [Labrenzia sp. 011]|uniref:hypothetical protein n=1 Tax=Labrenzia sp. 011 TaxID=2171494 RepID=UPI000D50EDEE|nr:hypothetical protein [Labrenzia sp. 011]PVB59918.1 hypothetical protein DCO57_19665 [Labrenzia sp. 011]
MVMQPSIFEKQYRPITVHTLDGTAFVNVQSYLSGEPRKKQFNAAALADLRRFLSKKDRYKDGQNGADRHSWDDKSGLTAFGLVGPGYFKPWLWVNITWKELQLGFYGKGTPERMRRILQVIDFYLKTAEIDLSRVHWNYVMSLEEYAKYYLGLDCNGFTGAFLESQYPSLGINGGDHINYLDGKLKKRATIAEIKPGDILSREGGGGTRHVAMVNSVSGVISPEATSAQVSITQSSFSLGGLNTKTYTLKMINEGPKNKPLNWHLAGFYKFNHCLALERK